MKKEVRIPYEKISNSQTIAQYQAALVKRLGGDIQRDEVDFEDDHDRQERIFRLKTRKTMVTF